MKFDAVNLAACIVPQGITLDPRCADPDFAASNPSLCIGDLRCADPAFAATNPSICNTQPPDQRCLDAEFAASNPSICGTTAYLIIKPATSLVCSLGSIQFRVFLYQNGVETEVTDSLTFSSSDQSILAIGVHIGAATGLAIGNVIVTVARLGITAKSNVTVITGCGVDGQGCDLIAVKTALLIDNSKSMGLAFGVGYSSRLAFAKAAALGYSDTILTVGGEPKDSIKVWSFGDVPDQISADFLTDTTEIHAEINAILQTQTKTDLASILTAAVNDLVAASADEKVIVIFSDGEQTLNAVTQPILDVANLFKEAGGIIICVGTRSSGIGYDLLSRIATGGFFLNSFPNNAAQILNGLNYLKSMLCAGECDVAAGTVNTPALDYSDFINWEVIAGQVNLIGAGLLDLQPNNGLYVDMMGGTAGTIRTINSFSLVAGRDYKISFRAAGNNRLNTPSAAQALLVTIKNANSSAPVGLATIFQHSVAPLWDDQFAAYSFTFTAAFDVDVKILFQQLYDSTFSGEWHGNLLDDVKFEEVSTLTTLLFDDFNGENPIYTAPSCWNIKNPMFPVVVEGAADGNGVYHHINGVYTSDDEPLFTITLEDGFWHIRLDGSDCYVSVTSNMFNGWSVGEGECGAPAPTSVHPFGITTRNTGYSCDDCDADAVSLQLQDPNPLPDVETGLPSSNTYTATKQACATCPAGSQNVDVSSYALVPDSYVDTTLDKTLVISFNDVQNVKSYSVNVPADGNCITPRPAAWTLYGSRDGTVWAVLDSRTAISWDACTEQSNTYTLPLVAGYRKFKFVVSAGLTGSALNSVVSVNLFGIIEGVSQVCKSASATSYISQQDADNKATAAALALARAALNCVQKFTSTQQYAAQCPVGSFGSSVTRSANATSYNSQADADATALLDATDQAMAALDCTASNNTQNITINDDAPATPYPSVQYVSGKVGVVTKVTVSIKKLTHINPEDIVIVLRAPTGETCVLMARCGGANNISNVDLVLDDAAGSFLPDSAIITSGTFKPKAYGASLTGLLDPPAPQTPYGTLLSVFNGINPNGSWSIWTQDVNALDSGQIANGWEISILSS